MIIVAHRGCPQQAEENSKEAFLLARQHAKHVEFDVQLTKDGVPVVVHDDHLWRLCGVDAKVSELFFIDLPKTKKRNSILALDEVIDLCDGMFMHVEIKNPKALVSSINLLKNRTFLISSFHLDVVKKASQHHETLFLMEHEYDQYLMPFSGAKWYGVHHSWFEHCRQPEQTYVYTVNCLRQAQKAKTLHLKGIYTDQPIDMNQHPFD